MSWVMSLANLFVASPDRVQFAFVILHLFVQFLSLVTRPNSNVHCQHRYAVQTYKVSAAWLSMQYAILKL